MPNDALKPEVIVFAGPNGSGKSTVTRVSKVAGIYINADNIKASTHCSDIDAALAAEKLRENMLLKKEPFTFETVLSTERNLNLLKRARENGYFIRGIYVLTQDPMINVMRVASRVEDGGHGVPSEKIVSRYHRSVALLPQFVEVCDICHVYDNTQQPVRIFKKRKDAYFYWPSEDWSMDKIHRLVGVE